MEELKVKWPKVVNKEPIVRWIDLGNGSMFRLSSFFSVTPRYGLIVALERVGAFFFDTRTMKTWDYVSEKLCLPESDARNIADWINAQLEFECEQQGIYEESYIRNVEPYFYSGEIPSLPLIPDIIE